MKTSSLKAKGRKLQQFVVKLILSKFPSLTGEDVRSTSMGNGGEDVQLSPLARKFVPYSIECKSYAKFIGYKFYDQAAANSKVHEPLVVVKANRRKPLVLIDAEYFFNKLL